MTQPDHDEDCRALTYIIERLLHGHRSRWALVVSHPNASAGAIQLQTYANTEDPSVASMLRAAANLLEARQRRATH